MDVICQADPEHAGITLVRVSGTLDAVGATRLWDDASPHVTGERPSMLVDMTQVHLMSSAGITTLIQLLKQIQPLGGKLCVFGCGPSVRKVFKIVGLETMLNVSETLTEARQRAGRAP